MVRNVASKKLLHKIHEEQKRVRLETLDVKKKRTAVQQDLYELEVRDYFEWSLGLTINSR